MLRLTLLCLLDVNVNHGCGATPTVVAYPTINVQACAARMRNTCVLYALKKNAAKIHIASVRVLPRHQYVIWFAPVMEENVSWTAKNHKYQIAAVIWNVNVWTVIPDIIHTMVVQYVYQMKNVQLVIVTKMNIGTNVDPAVMKTSAVQLWNTILVPAPDHSVLSHDAVSQRCATTDVNHVANVTMVIFVDTTDSVFIRMSAGTMNSVRQGSTMTNVPPSVMNSTAARIPDVASHLRICATKM